MLKDDHLRKTQQQQLQQDLQFMLSSIRARQNTLIFYLQKFKNSIQPTISQSFSKQQTNNQKHNIEMKLAKNEFQQKDKIYSKQITSILQKHNDFSLGAEYSVRAFWIKLKTILKVSIQRIYGLGITAGGIIVKLLQCYEKALTTVQRNSQAQKSLLAYRQVQNFFKKRTIEALLINKQALIHSPSISYSQTKMQKNRSQTLFKPTSDINTYVGISRFTIMDNNSNINRVQQSQQFYDKRDTLTMASNQRLHQRNYQYLHGLANIKEQSSNFTTGQAKIKSLNRIKNRRPDQVIKANIMNFIKVQQLGKLKSTSKASQKHIKKINKHVQRYQKNFQGAFDGKYEVSTLLDKKKTIFQNIYLLYDNLFAKNIPNHKMISKFMFNTTKINQLLYSAYEKKKRLNKKEKQKEKQKDKQNKDKQKNNGQGKEKQKKHNKDKDNKQKEKEKQKQKDHTHNYHLLNDEKQRNHTAKHQKNHRKLAKQHHNHIDIFTLNTKQKQHHHLREKKQSQTTAMTAMTSKHQTNHRQINYQKHDKDKSDKEKQKKIMRSKTAKIKLNSEIHHPHTLAINPNFLIGKHFASQHQGHKTNQKLGHTQKIVKTIGV